jgi:MtN3 and saliva related transmembrane protein
MIGIIAVLLTTSSIIPQLIKTYKSKEVNDLSLIQMLVLFIGVGCWLAYGIQINDSAVIAANSISLFLQGLLVAMKIKYTQWAKVTI